MKINLLILLSVISTITFGQSLVVTLNNGNTESFPILDIQSIKFGSIDMTLYKLDGTTNIWNINDIDYYAFDDVISVNDNFQNLEERIDIFPNPTVDKLTIHYQNNSSDEITISIIDMHGKQVMDLFKGKHYMTTVIEWSVQSGRNIQSGIYICKITTSNKIITRPIIIQ